ncbi:MAG: hypothetical protein H6515_14260 [Microthrixaceae bacterium]|nr:hypothetical protein [Microthrixaceae bacterium]
MVASRTVLVRIRADADQFNREVVTSTGSMRKLGDESDRTSDRLDENGKSIDRYSGRLAVLGQVIGSLGPGLTPIIGATAQATAGLATELGFAALAAGSAIIAFQGIGDAMKAVSEARINPTTANLQKARQAMEQLSPAGQDLVHTLSGLSDEWKRTKAIAQGGLFPGVESSVDSLMSRLPELQQILATVSTTAGDLLAEGADSLASSRWDDLFNYLETSAKPIMTDTAHTAGSLTHALSELIIAMDPLSRDFSAGLAAAADSLDRWATGLSKTQDFQDFVAYMRVEGPRVTATIGDIAGSLVSILEAGSGAGSASLQILQAISATIETIADSPLGPVLIQLVQVVSTMALLNRGWNLFSTGTVGNFVRGQTQAVAALRATISAEQVATLTTDELVAAQRNLYQQQSKARGTLARGIAGIAGLGLAALDSQHHITGLSTISGALMGSIAGPWGAAIGGAIGLMQDFSQANQEAKQQASDFAQTLDQQTGALTENSAAWVAQKLDADGYLETAEKLGLSTGDITRTILEGKDAVDAYAESMIEAANASGQITDPTYRNDLTDLLGQMTVLGGTVDEGSRQFRAIQSAVVDTSGAFENASTKVERFTTAVEELNGILDKRGAWRAYEQSIDDAAKALKENGKGLDINKQKGRDNAAAIDDMIRSTADLAGQLKGTNRQAFLTQAQDDILAMARKLGASKQQLQEYRRELQLLNGTTVNTYVRTIYKESHSSGLGPQPAGHADGGLVRGPGTRTSDSILRRLSDYEYVQRAAAVDYYGVAFMDAVNGLRFPKEAPAVHPFAGGTGSWGGGGNVAGAIGLTNARLDRLERSLVKALSHVGPAAGNAVVDRLNQGAAHDMRTADL